MRTANTMETNSDFANWVLSQKPTIYDIKRAVADSSPYYFSTNTMKFFRQTLAGFKVYKLGVNRWLIQNGKSKREFHFTGYNIGELSHVDSNK